MARTEVFLKLDGEVKLWRTNLTGYGPVRTDEEFVTRQVEQYDRPRLVRDGKRLKVRVVHVERVSRSYHILTVDVLEDLTPATAPRLFE